MAYQHEHHSVIDNCSMDHVHWAWDIFNECVVDGTQYAGFLLGLLSIVCWIFVFLPQFIMSFKTGQMDEAVSPFFLISWLLGDLSNLIGCILTHQLGTQIATAYYYISMDALMLLQYTYYVIRNRRRRGRNYQLVEQNGHIRPTSNNYTAVQQTDQNTRQNPALYCVGGLFVFTYLFSVQSFGSNRIESESRSAGRSLLSVSTGNPPEEECKVYFGDTGDCLFQDKKELIGYCIGSLSGLFYLGSRLPQIIKNFQRQSVEGLSVFMFILAVLGNSLYGASILMQDTELLFIVKHMPWLVGSIGTLTFDACLLVQFTLYRRDKRETSQDADETRSLLTPSFSPNGSIAGS